MLDGTAPKAATDSGAPAKSAFGDREAAARGGKRQKLPEAQFRRMPKKRRPFRSAVLIVLSRKTDDTALFQIYKHQSPGVPLLLSGVVRFYAHLFCSHGQLDHL